jgi:hypothetical protein
MTTSTAALTVAGLTVTGTSQVLSNVRPALALSEVQYAPVSVDALGPNTLVDAVVGGRIRVVQMVLVASGGANTAQLYSGAGDIPITGALDIGDNRQMTLPHNPAGWCETGVSELLDLTLSDATLVAGMVGYVIATETA